MGVGLFREYVGFLLVFLLVFLVVGKGLPLSSTITYALRTVSVSGERRAQART